MCESCKRPECCTPSTCPDKWRLIPLPDSLPVSVVCTACGQRGIGYWPANWRRVVFQCGKCGHKRQRLLSQLPPRVRALVAAHGAQVRMSAELS